MFREYLDIDDLHGYNLEDITKDNYEGATNVMIRVYSDEVIVALFDIVDYTKEEEDRICNLSRDDFYDFINNHENLEVRQYAGMAKLFKEFPDRDEFRILIEY